ncbi:MAG: DUF4268 domain-containing protein [Verrucomicrobia bacterium]|nr:DUF4268 domain-containing protein [Verrucomicrobiota bacterium]
MFRIDRSTNTISKLKSVKFADLGFKEREHLQEWLASQPDALGEELLIVQKEFSGFDDTRERLDLLALDKNGGLVIIENKLDDSGRDVVWQSLKYASYCSTLSKTSIATIYQQYLDQHGMHGNAQERICEFLEQEDFGEVKLNSGIEQRIIMVAAQFRKEVTSTVLWLLKHDVKVQCFKATPFQHEDSMFLNLEQVIPLAEAEDLMIGITEKEKEEHTTERGQASRHSIRTEFWHKMLEALEKADVDLYENISPSRDHWLSAGSGLAGVHYNLIFSKSGVRVEFVMARGTKEKNKAMFDHLLGKKERLEKLFGASLDWRQMTGNKASIISFGKEFEGYDRNNWTEMISWLTEHIRRMEAAFGPEVDDLRQLLRTRFPG